MIAAIFGLIGVMVGALLTIAKDWWFQSMKSKKDAEYLAIQVSCALEQYSGQCAVVVGDDGLYQGQPDENGCRRSQVSEPAFELESLKVEWKSLPAHLMYEVLDFPYKVKVASQSVAAKFDYVAMPPDYEEGFEERQFQFATLGITASNLAAKLRDYVELPARIAVDWDPVSYMKEQKTTIEQQRTERASRHLLPDL